MSWERPVVGPVQAGPVERSRQCDNHEYRRRRVDRDLELTEDGTLVRKNAGSWPRDCRDRESEPKDKASEQQHVQKAPLAEFDVIVFPPALDQSRAQRVP